MLKTSSAGADRQRDENPALIAPRETLAPPIEAKFVKQEYFGRGEHAHASLCFRGSAPPCVGRLCERSGPILTGFRDTEKALLEFFWNFFSPAF